MKALALLTIFAVAAVQSTSAAVDPVLFGVRESAGQTFNAKTGAKGLFQPFTQTFAQNKTWTSPVFPWQSYRVPDQFDLSPVDDTQVSSVSTFSANFSDALHTYISWHIVYGIVPLPVFSAAWVDAHELGAIKGAIKLGAALYGWSQYITRHFSLSVKPAYALDVTEEFQALVDALPSTATSTSDKNKLTHFLDQVGTHYVCRGTYGGRLSMTTFLDAVAAGEFSGAAAFKEMGMLFHLSFFHLSQSQFKNKNDIDLSAKFRERSTSQIFFTGGDLKLQTENPIAQLLWLDSISDAAALLEPTLCPLTDLVADEAKKAVLETATWDYLNKIA